MLIPVLLIGTIIKGTIDGISEAKEGETEKKRITTDQVEEFEIDGSKISGEFPNYTCEQVLEHLDFTIDYLIDYYEPDNNLKTVLNKIVQTRDYYANLVESDYEESLER